MQIEHELGVQMVADKPYEASVNWLKTKKGRSEPPEEPNGNPPTSNRQLPQHHKKKAGAGSGVAKSLLSLMTVLLTVGVVAGSGTAVDPMLCSKEAVSTLYDLSSYYTSCSQKEPTVMEMAKQLTIYEYNTGLHDQEATLCTRKRTSLLHNSFIGAHSTTNPEVKAMDLSAEECERWVATKSCNAAETVDDTTTTARREMEFGRDGVWHTDERASITTPSWYQIWKWGNTNKAVENCYIANTTIFSSAQLSHISTPHGSSKHCRYSSGRCLLPDGSVLLWTPRKAELCPIVKMTKMNGSLFYEEEDDKWVWTEESRQFSLTFPKKPQEAMSCRWHYVLSEQAYAVESHVFTSFEEDYQRAKKRESRTKRSTTTGTVKTPQLAATETAAMKHMEKSLRQGMKGLKEMICSMARSMHSTSAEEATLLARKILGTPYVQAEFPVDESIMEAWPCQRVPVILLTFLKSDKCFKHPLVNATLSDGRTITRHLNTRLMILIESSEVGPCEVYRIRLVRWRGDLLKVDQMTGNVEKVGVLPKKINGLGGQKGLTHIVPLAFENMVFGNELDAAEKLDKMFEAARAHEVIDSHKTWEHDGEGDTGVGHHEMPSLSGYLFGWFWNPPLFLISTVVYGAILVLIGWLFKMLAWPCIVTKILKKAHLLQTKENKALHDEMRQMREVMESLVGTTHAPAASDAELKLLKEELKRLKDEVKTRKANDTDEGMAETSLRRGAPARKTQRLADSLRSKSFFQVGSEGNSK
jgi:hypothetical protein